MSARSLVARPQRGSRRCAGVSRGVRARDILELGLHDYLDELLGLLADLGGALQSDYFEAHLGDTP